MKNLQKAIMIHVDRVMDEYNVTMEQAEELVYQSLMSGIVTYEMDLQIEYIMEKTGLKKPVEKLKHKNIKLTEMKKLFPEYKITKKILKSYVENDHDVVSIDGIEVDLSTTRKRTQIFAKFIKDGFIYHMAC